MPADQRLKLLMRTSKGSLAQLERTLTGLSQSNDNYSSHLLLQELAPAASCTLRTRRKGFLESQKEERWDGGQEIEGTDKEGSKQRKEAENEITRCPAAFSVSAPDDQMVGICSKAPVQIKLTVYSKVEPCVLIKSFSFVFNQHTSKFTVYSLSV